MKTVVYDKYGGPEVLKVIEADCPVLTKPHQLVVQVLYSSLNAIDWKNRRGNFRLVTGPFKPRTKQGFDFMGMVVNKGRKVSEFQIGDSVVGQLGNLTGGALSEFIVVDQSRLIVVPKHIDQKQLGGMPMAATTAWQALFENADLREGHSVLINGGSSGVGHFAIQIAKAYGAEVTSVSSAKNKNFCRAIGADFVVDYENEDFTKLKRKFNIVFDVVFSSSYDKVKDILMPQGCYIGTTPSLRLISDIALFRKVKFVAVRPNKKALTDIVRLMEVGQVTTHIQKEFAMDEIVEAHTQMEASKTVGKLIVRVGQ